MRRTNKKSKRYLELVHLLPCVVSGQMFVSAHHPRAGMGMGQKAPDYWAFPLCYDLHQGRNGIHTLGTRAWQKIYGDEMDMAKATQLMLKDMIEIPKEYRLY